MKQTNHAVALLKSGRDANSPIDPPSELKKNLLRLLDVVDSRYNGSLPLEGPWRLKPSVARHLHSNKNTSPIGGWNGLIGLAGGGPFFKTNRDAFVPTITTDELAQMDPETIQKELLEAFTTKLIPPSTAAGLFLLLGIHPVWGLRVARRIQRQRGEGPPEIESKSEVREASLRLLRQTVFEALAGMIALLRNLEPEKRYPIELLSKSLYQCCRAAKVNRGSTQTSDEQFPIFFIPDHGENTQFKALDFATNDFFSSFLAPAGAGYVFNDDTFCVEPNRLESIKVDKYSPDEQNHIFAKQLYDRDEHVA